MTGRAIMAAVILLASCSREPDFYIPVPLFNGLSVPSLSGDVVVTDSGSSEVGRSSLTLEGSHASTRVESLPTNEDLTAVVTWRSGETIVAQSIPFAFRTAPGKTASVAVTKLDYFYPDDDGDGATNLTEAVFASDDPGAGDAVNDPNIAPDGFFSALVAAYGTSGMGTRAAFTGSDDILVGAQFPVGSTAQVTGHHVQFIHPREQRTKILWLDECPDGGLANVITDVVKNPNYSEAAVACTGKVYVLDTSTEEVTTVLDVGGFPKSVTYADSGRRLLVPLPEDMHIKVFDCAGYQLESILNTGTLGAGSIPYAVTEIGGYLVVADVGAARLIALGLDGEGTWQRVGYALEGLLSFPFVVVAHPLADVLYVGDDNGVLHVVDTSSPNPDAWRIKTSIEVGGSFLMQFEVDPVYGAWIYMVTDERLLRIDTMTHSITRAIDHGDLAFWMDIAIAPQGDLAVVPGFADQSLFVLDHLRQPGNFEFEPNHSPDALVGLANVIGPLPTSVAASGDNRETGAFTYQSPLLAVAEDIEDLWRLDPTGASGPLALAVMPTSVATRMNLLVLDENGNVVTSAVFPVGDVVGNNTGVFVVTPPVSGLPAPTLVGVDIFDPLTSGADQSGYTLLAVELPVPSPVHDEAEPNGTEPEAEAVVVTSGYVIRGDAGLGDIDCFLVDLDKRFLAVRLNPAANVDLDLVVRYDTFVDEVSGQVSLAARGASEFFVFDPILYGELDFFVCVENTDQDAADVSYELTFVDFTPAYPPPWGPDPG